MRFDCSPRRLQGFRILEELFQAFFQVTNIAVWTSESRNASSTIEETVRSAEAFSERFYPAQSPAQQDL
jgi:hypothetical protein